MPMQAREVKTELGLIDLGKAQLIKPVNPHTKHKMLWCVGECIIELY